MAPDRVAHFFVPLPEPIGLPDGYEYRVVAHPTGSELRELIEAGHEDPAQGHLETVLTFHHADMPSHLTATLNALVMKAKTVLGTGAATETPSDPPPVRRAQMTVVQIAVQLRELETEDTNEDALTGSLTKAFDLGLGRLRNFQRAYFGATRQPVRLASREAMPSIVPAAVQTIELGEVTGVEHLAYALNTVFDSEIRYAALTSEEEAALEHHLYARDERRAFHARIDLHREATDAFDRRGDYRGTVLLVATEAEVLLDEMLAHLLWERGDRPEDASPVFDDPFISRVKKHFPPILGGNWDLTCRDPVGDWSRLIKQLRDRVVHAGYEPTREEASGAYDAVIDLEGFLKDRLLDKLRTYPRTAIAIMGIQGLQSRSRFEDWLKPLVEGDDWAQTYVRWWTAMRRETRDGREHSPPPNSAQARTCLVARVTDEGTVLVDGYLVDDDAGKAAQFDLPSELPTDLQKPVSALREALRHRGRARDAVTVTVLDYSPEHPIQPWKPTYRAIPGAGVMVDGNDIDEVV